MATRWFFVMTDRNGVSPARVFSPGSTGSVGLTNGSVEAQNSSFTWPVTSGAVPATVGPDANWSAIGRQCAGGYRLIHISGANSLVRKFGPSKDRGGTTPPTWPNSLVRFEWRKWVTGAMGRSGTGHRAAAACPALIIGSINDATVGVRYGSPGLWRSYSNEDTTVPRDRAWSTVQQLSVAWTSQSDAGTEAIVSAATTALGAGNYFSSNGQPGAGELYIRSLEAAAYAWAVTNIGA